MPFFRLVSEIVPIVLESIVLELLHLGTYVTMRHITTDQPAVAGISHQQIKIDPYNAQPHCTNKRTTAVFQTVAAESPADTGKQAQQAGSHVKLPRRQKHAKASLV